MKCAGVTPAVTATPRRLAARTRSSAARGGDLAQVQPRSGHLGQRDVARRRQRFGFGGRARQAEPGRHLARGGRGLAGEPVVLGVGDDDQAEHRRVLQQPVHHPAVADPAPPGGDRLGPGVAHQRDLGELRAVERDRRRGQRMDPQVGLAARRGEADPRRVVERRRLVGHQRRAGDPAEMERRLVDREDAEIDEAGRDQPAAGVDDVVAVLRPRVADRLDAAFDAAQRARDRAARQ